MPRGVKPLGGVLLEPAPEQTAVASAGYRMATCISLSEPEAECRPQIGGHPVGHVPAGLSAASSASPPRPLSSSPYVTSFSATS
jgi:hypothetical protein